MEALNEVLQEVFKEFNESSHSEYSVTKWRVGIARYTSTATLASGRVVPLYEKRVVVIIVEGLLDKREKYHIDNPSYLTFKEREELEIKLSEYLDRKLRRKLGGYSLRICIFTIPNFPVRYAEAEENSSAFLLAFSFLF